MKQDHQRVMVDPNLLIVRIYDSLDCPECLKCTDCPDCLDCPDCINCHACPDCPDFPDFPDCMNCPDCPERRDSVNPPAPIINASYTHTPWVKRGNCLFWQPKMKKIPAF